jgi:hypothetical protein
MEAVRSDGMAGFHLGWQGTGQLLQDGITFT